MSKSDQINADLDALGIDYDPDSHWKTRQKLLDDAKEQLGVSAEMSVAGQPDAPEIAPPPPANPGASGEPPMTASEGDKTPAVVAWRRANWPADKFAKVYGGRNIPA